MALREKKNVLTNLTATNDIRRRGLPNPTQPKPRSNCLLAIISKLLKYPSIFFFTK